MGGGIRSGRAKLRALPQDELCRGFVQINSSSAHGANKEYLVSDDQVYKNAMDQVDYRLEVVFTNGLRQRLAEKQVDYTPTAIRRSWEA